MLLELVGAPLSWPRCAILSEKENVYIGVYEKFEEYVPYTSHSSVRPECMIAGLNKTFGLVFLFLRRAQTI